MKYKYIVVESFGQIGVLGGISGPIRNPIKLSIDQIYQLLRTGKKVFEVKSLTKTEPKIELTIFNYNKNNFPVKKRTVTPKLNVENKVESPALSPKNEDKGKNDNVGDVKSIKVEKDAKADNLQPSKVIKKDEQKKVIVEPKTDKVNKNDNQSKVIKKDEQKKVIVEPKTENVSKNDNQSKVIKKK